MQNLTLLMERPQDAHHSPEPGLALDYNATGGMLTSGSNSTLFSILKG